MTVSVQFKFVFREQKNIWPIRNNFKNFVFCSQRNNGRRTDDPFGTAFKTLYFTVKNKWSVGYNKKISYFSANKQITVWVYAF